MNFDFNNYGLGREWDLIDYESELEKELKEKLGIQPQRAGMMVNQPRQSGLDQFLPTSFDTQGTADAIKAIDAMMGVGGVAPTGINPDAPAESQPPVVTPTPTAVDPNKYERMQGVTDTDRLSAVAMGMTAIGSPDFARVYGGLQAGLVQKQKTADEYNMLLDMGTKPATEIKGSYLVTYEPDYIRNSDGTYSVNPKAGQIRHKERSNPSFEDMGVNEKNYDMYERMIAEGKWIPKYDDRAKDYRYWGETYLRSGGVNDANRNSLSRTLEEVAGLDPAQAELASYWNRDDVIEYGDEDGNFFAYNPATGERIDFRTKDESAAFKRLLAQDKADIDTMATITADQVPKLMDNIRDGELEYIEIDNSLDDIYEWYETFDQMTDEQYADVGGWYNNFMYQVFGITDEEAMLAGYDQAQIRSAIEGLKTVNVAPVSNFEFNEFKKLLGTNKIQDRRALVKLLKRAVDRKARELGQKGARINDDIGQLRKFDNERFGSMYNGMGVLSIEDTLEKFGT